MEVDPVISIADSPARVNLPLVPLQDLVTGEYEWKVSDWSRLDEKEWSDRFHIAGRDWRIMLFPRGNYQQGSNSNSIAAYLQLCDLDREESRWGLTTNFKLTVVNQRDERESSNSETTHTFTADASDHGFARMHSLADIESDGCLIDNTVIIRARIIVDMKQSSLYDSRKETGFVGLRNQGATCYLNSWLQTLYNINIFRQAVYTIPTSEETEPASSIALALQAMFFQLQYSMRSVSTEDLTKSFGWDSSGSLMQEDVHEFNKILCETLEEKMKGSKACGLTDKIFAGHILKFIRCLNVDFKSEKSDMFQDIILDVRGCSDVYASFDRITAEDTFDGENQYECEGHGKQDAKFGDLYVSFPPVLQLHLKRFEYDFDRDVRVKVNDRYEYPEMLDLDVDDRKYQAANADRTKRNMFKLHSVLVHSGNTHGGHYYAFSRPDGQQWLRFDDEKVTKVESYAALEEQYGADPHQAAGGNSLSPTYLPETAPQNLSNAVRASRFSNAYMLLYVREEDWDTIMCPVTDSDIPPHLARRVQAEEQRLTEKSRERDEEDRFRVVQVATVDDMREHVGQHTFWDLVDWSKVRNWKQPRKTLLHDFKKQLAADLNYDEARGQRLWLCCLRPNNATRPKNPIPASENERKIGDLGDCHQNAAERRGPLQLFIFDTSDVKASPADHFLLFFKHYDPRSCRLRFLKCLLVPKATTNKKLKSAFADMVNIPSQTLELVEEVAKHDTSEQSWDVLPEGAKLAQMCPQHGDIIVGQERWPEGGPLKYPTIQQYFAYIAVRRLVSLKPLSKPKSEGILVNIPGDSNYEGIAKAVAAELNCDWRRLRLTAHSQWSRSPKANHIRWGTDQNLDKLIGNFSGRDSEASLYYEVLDMTLEALEMMRTLTVTIHDLQTIQTGTRTLQVRRELLVRDVMALLHEEQPPQSPPLHLMEVIDSEIYKVLTDDVSVEELKLDNVWQLMAMPIGEIPPGGSLLPFVHIPPSAETLLRVQPSGIPFMMGVSPIETAAELLLRVQKRLAISGTDAESWSLFLVVQLRKPVAIADDEIVLERFSRRQSTDDFTPRASFGESLGLSHASKGPKRIKRAAVRDADRPLRIG